MKMILKKNYNQNKEHQNPCITNKMKVTFQKTKRKNLCKRISWTVNVAIIALNQGQITMDKALIVYGKALGQ